MRHLLTAILLFHGAIHLFGFLKWSKLSEVPQLSGRTLISLGATAGQLFALLWLMALVGLLTAAILHATHHSSWWTLALGGLLLSQFLIVFAWHDAKFGTLANALILVPVVVAGAHARFEHAIATEIRTLLAAAPKSGSAIVRAEELGSLPPPVRAWLAASGVVGHERAHTVRLRQAGELRTSPDAAWMPAQAEQYFVVDEPAFIWRVDATMMHVFPFAGRDSYSAGAGHMLIKAASLLNVVDGHDEKIAHGALLRFLGEMIWFPSAALSPYIQWEGIDETHAQATMRHAGLIASARFSFDAQHRFIGLHAERYLGGGQDAKLTPWSVSCSEWQTMDGIEVPTKGDVSWQLSTGNFSYYRWQILDVQYNRAGLYGDPNGQNVSVLARGEGQ